MSEAAYLTCPLDRVIMLLGKPVRKKDGSILCFHRRGSEKYRNSEDPLLNKALWKFLADHAGHSLRLASSYDDDFEITASFAEVGGDEIDGISFEDYIKDWPG